MTPSSRRPDAPARPDPAVAARAAAEGSADGGALSSSPGASGPVSTGTSCASPFPTVPGAPSTRARSRTSASSSSVTPCSGSSWPSTSTAATPRFPRATSRDPVRRREHPGAGPRRRRTRARRDLRCSGGARTPRAGAPRSRSWPTPSRPSSAPCTSAGIERAGAFVMGLLGDELDEISRRESPATTQEPAPGDVPRRGVGPPRYVVTEQGPEHAKRYVAKVYAPARASAGGGAFEEGRRAGRRPGGDRRPRRSRASRGA